MTRTRGGHAALKRWLRGQVEKAEKQAVQMHQKIHISLSDGLIRDTPVGNPSLWKSPPPKGYSGGRAKGNWQSHVGSRGPGGETGRIDPGGGSTLAAGVSVALNIKAGDLSTIVNNAPYIRRLNNTPQWSSQQTPHWVERNLQRVKAEHL